MGRGQEARPRTPRSGFGGRTLRAMASRYSSFLLRPRDERRKFFSGVVKTRPHRVDRHPLERRDFFAAVSFDFEKDERRASRLVHPVENLREETLGFAPLEKLGRIAGGRRRLVV